MPGLCARHPGEADDAGADRRPLLDRQLEDHRGGGQYRPTNCPPAYVTIFLEVEVDTWTGQVRTLKAVSGSDCGTVVNPDLAAGQLEGGLSKGVGYALIEDNGWDADGQLRSKGYWVDGKTPGIAETPLLADLSIHFADTYEPSGPFGAKGIGEAAMNPVAAAYANAIYNAIGIRFYELPITPEKILAALKTRRKTKDERRIPEDTFVVRRSSFVPEGGAMNDMTNSHILVHEFSYLEPRSVSEAIELLAAHGDAARILAGGTDLLVQMKMERQKPAYVIGIGELDRVARHPAGHRQTDHRRIDDHPRSCTGYDRARGLHRAGRSVRRGIQHGAGAGDGHGGRQPVQRLTGLRHRPGPDRAGRGGRVGRPGGRDAAAAGALLPRPRQNRPPS